jgi:hypothetical protein
MGINSPYAKGITVYCLGEIQIGYWKNGQLNKNVRIIYDNGT